MEAERGELASEGVEVSEAGEAFAAARRSGAGEVIWAAGADVFEDVGRKPPLAVFQLGRELGHCKRQEVRKRRVRINTAAERAQGGAATLFERTACPIDKQIKRGWREEDRGRAIRRISTVGFRLGVRGRREAKRLSAQ